jgi:hypothetical protein
MPDILDDLRDYLAGDNAVVMSPRRVNEMIVAFDALRAELAAEREWRPMATAPTDGTPILAAVRVYHSSDKRLLLYLDIQAVRLEEGLALTSCGDDCGWSWEDFEVWKPIALDNIDAALKGGE